MILAHLVLSTFEARDFAIYICNQCLYVNYIINANPASFEKVTFPMSRNLELIKKSTAKSKVSNLCQKNLMNSDTLYSLGLS